LLLWAPDTTNLYYTCVPFTSLLHTQCILVGVKINICTIIYYQYYILSQHKYDTNSKIGGLNNLLFSGYVEPRRDHLLP